MWTDDAWDEEYNNSSSGIKFHEDLRVKSAEVKHICGLCNSSIDVGRPYRRQVGMGCGDTKPWALKEHLDCYAEYSDVTNY